MPETPPPITSAFGSTGFFNSSKGSSNLTRATPILTSSFAFSVAFSGSFMWTQEHCSLMLTNVKRYLFSPASSQVDWKSGPCVLGVHEATTTLLRLCSLMPFCTALRPSSAHIYRSSSAWTTPGRVLAYSATEGTSTTPPMLEPQWHTKTPTLLSVGKSTVCSSGFFSSVSSASGASSVSSASSFGASSFT